MKTGNAPAESLKQLKQFAGVAIVNLMSIGAS